MAHLTVKYAHLQVVKMNIALYDYLSDVIDVVNLHTKWWLEETRYSFMADALQYINATDDLAAVLGSDIRVHKCRLVQEIDRNRELRRHVNAVNQYWYSKWKDGAVVHGCSSSAIYSMCRTDVNKDLPETVPVTELCKQLLHTYYYKNDSDVVKALPLLMAPDATPAPTKCPPITAERHDAGAKQPVPFTKPNQPVQDRLLALASTLTSGGDKDVLDLPATATPEPASVSRTTTTDVTTVPAPWTSMGGTDPDIRRQQAAEEIEEKRQRMSQWFTDQALHISENRKRKRSELDKILPQVKRQRTMPVVPRPQPPRSVLKLTRRHRGWGVDNRGARSGHKRHC